jgi:hypothetical protein
MKKKIFLLSVLIALVANAMAYTPIVVEGYKWNVVYIGNGGTFDKRIYSTNREKIEGDSIVNDIVYKKLWESNDCKIEKTSLLALIREDIAEQKVYAYNDGVEVLLYDFDVEVGDTIKVWNWLHQLKHLNSSNIHNVEYRFSHLVVEKVDYIDDEVYGSLKKITYYRVGKENIKIIIYERYGALTGWAISKYVDIEGRGHGSMICAFDANDELLFKPTYNNELDEIENCYISETKTDIEIITTPTTPAIQKIIHNGQVYILRNGKVYNMVGIEVKNIDFNNF